ncbi:DUF4197 domain-containing protein [Allopontixanthobacter sp.]|uniref:DUF4197 domain-containing protein n=1 Tax=Allopontixanthobacter sp. TaxID=2906452 RepID=UPI002ABB2303|nr:DUF4197 domain-containing protein [Allopontixanthobacter sp.]MDZ4306650.1 DUF4197 domain-containing protein [Allopontixanthobacter sp.]
MNELIGTRPARRGFLVGLSATAALLALPGCATTGGYSFTEAIRRLLMLSSERAFARLTADGGFWDQQVAQIGFANLLGTRGDVLSSILSSPLFKSRLNDAFAGVAIEGSYRAAPVVADAVRVIGIENAVALVRGGPTAATSFLQGEMGGRLVEVLVPEIGGALRAAQDPLVGQVLSALTGVNTAQVASNFSARVNDVIWNEIAREESAIRADPRSTRDPMIIGVFGAGNAF